jgi:hypothetical protein
LTFYFVGGEDHDFSKIGSATVDTATTAARRSANARCALKVGPLGAITDGWQLAFDAARSSFWFTARAYQTSAATSGTAVPDFLSFLDGTVRRLGFDYAANSAVLRLYKRTSTGTKTALATSSVSISPGTLQKIDVQVVYAVAGSVNLYMDGTLVLAYTGDTTTDSATSLSGAVLGINPAALSNTQTVSWSEIICGSEDTRSMNLVTLAPSANGNSFAWTGSYANLNEVTLDDGTLCASATAGDLAQMAINSSGITGNPAVKAIAISARIQKGASGPQNLQMNVRTGGNDYFGPTQALPSAFGRVAYTFENNPASSGPWGYADLTNAGFNVGLKSIA